MMLSSYRSTRLQYTPFPSPLSMHRPMVVLLRKDERRFPPLSSVCGSTTASRGVVGSLGLLEEWRQNHQRKMKQHASPE